MSVIKSIKSLLKSASGFAEKDSVRDFISSNPLAALGLIAPTGQFLGQDIVAPIAKGAYETLPIQGAIDEVRDRQRFQEFQDAQNFRLTKQLRDQRIREMVERNMAVVQARDPHLYSQVMAGRVLPQGAVVLGGRPRTDLMEELAYSMGTSSSPQEFSSLFQ